MYVRWLNRGNFYYENFQYLYVIFHILINFNLILNLLPFTLDYRFGKERKSLNIFLIFRLLHHQMLTFHILITSSVTMEILSTANQRALWNLRLFDKTIHDWFILTSHENVFAESFNKEKLWNSTNQNIYFQLQWTMIPVNNDSKHFFGLWSIPGIFCTLCLPIVLV